MKSLLRNVTLLLVLFTCCVPWLSRAQIITTVAGNGVTGSSGDGGPATAAQLSLPTGVFVDGSGTIYIADYNAHRIRRVNTTTGVITTIAGTGTAGFSGDAGSPTSAQLNSPNSVCVDASGNIYIADVYNHRIRRINAVTGTIGTVAGNGTAAFSGDGGLATAASLSLPTGVAVDAAGNLYIADKDNNRIRKVTAATGIISTIAGTGSFGFSGDGGLATAANLANPHAICVDASGNIYFTDQANFRVRKITAATGFISTVAGSGTSGFTGDGGSATSARVSALGGIAVDAGGNIYIDDYNNNRIRKITAATGYISTIAGTGGSSFAGDGGLASSSQVSNPLGVFVDGIGNVYIGDSYNRRVRKILNVPPTPVVTATVTYCQGATATALSASGTALLWYTVPSGGTGSATAPTPSTATAGTTTYYVTQTLGGIESPRASIAVTVNPTPAAPSVTTPVVYCTGATAAALTATGTNLKWYTAATGGTGSSTAPTPSTASAGSTTWYVSQTTALSCEGPRAALTVTVNATPAAPTVTTPVNYCIGATASALTATAISGATLKWYTVAAGGTGSTTAPTPGTTTLGTTTWYVSQTSGAGCEGPRAAISVVINAIPAAPAVSTPVVYCQEATAIPLSATGTNLKWYTGPTGGTGSSTAPTPGTATAGITNYYVSQTSSVGCESSRAIIAVVINALPDPPGVVTPQKRCVGGPTAILTAAGSNLKWYTAPTGGIPSTTAPTPPTGTVGVTPYFVTQTNSFSCESKRANIDVYVYALPTGAISPFGAPDFAFCPGDGVTIKVKGPALVGFQWQLSGSDIAGAKDSTYKAYTAGPYSVVVTDTNNCSNTISSAYVFKDTLPTPKLTPLSSTFCAGTNIMLFCTPSNPGYIYEWNKDGTVIIAAGTSNSKYPSGDPGTYKVKVTDIYGCVTTTNTAILNTYPAIVKPAIIRVDPTLRINNLYPYYQWYRNFKPIPGANGITYTMLYDGTYHAEVQDANGCKSYTDTITVINLSVDEFTTANQVKLYPNPAQDKITIDAPVAVTITVRDITGRVVLTQENTKEIHVGSLTDGLYIFNISDRSGKLIKVEKVYKSGAQ